MPMILDPNWRRGYLIPYGRDKRTGQGGMAVPGVIQDMLSAVMAPGEVYQNPLLMIDPDTGRTSDYAIQRSADLAGMMTLGSGAIPAEANSLRQGLRMYGGEPTKTVASDDINLMRVLEARAAEMDMPKASRTQPSGASYFENSAEAYRDPRYMPPQTPTSVPRKPSGIKYPKGNRAAILDEMSDEIATVLAKRGEKFLGTPAEFFYRTGPIRKKAIELGVPENEVDQWMREFSQMYAATSPRTETAQNLRNATLVMAKNHAGIPLEQVMGAGTGGLNEKGYPMMIGPSGIHGQLVSAVKGGGIDFNTNPKPATFAENVYGNLDGVTADTHAIRGALDALNEIRPGEIPAGFIRPEFRDAYQADPSQLNPATWIDDTLATQMLDKTAKQTEYAPFSDVYRKMAEKLGVTPADAQSLGWFGSGDKTNLASETKTVADLLGERIDVTAKLLGTDRDTIFRKLLKKEIPLAALVGAASMGTITQQQGEELKARGYN